MENLPLQHISSKIYEIRDIKVMLDSDIAKLYDVETNYLNRQVKRHFERFNETDFLKESASTRCFNSQKMSLKT